MECPVLNGNTGAQTMLCCSAIGIDSDFWKESNSRPGEARKDNPGGVVIHAEYPLTKGEFPDKEDAKDSELIKGWAGFHVVEPVNKASGCRFTFKNTKLPKKAPCLPTFTYVCNACKGNLVVKPNFGPSPVVDYTVTWKHSAVEAGVAVAAGDPIAAAAAREVQQRQQQHDDDLRKVGLNKVPPGQLEEMCAALGFSSRTRNVLKGNVYEVKREALATRHAACQEDSNLKHGKQQFSTSEWARANLADMTGQPFAVFTCPLDDNVRKLVLMHLNGGSTDVKWPANLVVHQDTVWATAAFADVSDRGPARKSPVNLGMAGLRVNATDKKHRSW